MIGNNSSKAFDTENGSNAIVDGLIGHWTFALCGLSPLVLRLGLAIRHGIGDDAFRSSLRR